MSLIICPQCREPIAPWEHWSERHLLECKCSLWQLVRVAEKDARDRAAAEWAEANDPGDNIRMIPRASAGQVEDAEMDVPVRDPEEPAA